MPKKELPGVAPLPDPSLWPQREASPPRLNYHGWEKAAERKQFKRSEGRGKGEWIKDDG